MIEPPIVLPPAMLDELRATFRTPPRAYHDFSHVLAVLDHYAAVTKACGWHQPIEVYLAVLYHDAIYEAGAHDNESRSAVLARAAIEQHLPGAAIAIDVVERLITLTSAHGRIDAAGHDDDTAHFLDCDMAILGAEPDVFDAYERAIGQEYASLPSDVYRKGRAAFVERLLARDAIFLSKYFRDRFEARARANLRRAIERG